MAGVEISQEEFDAWRENAVTQSLFKSLAHKSDSARQTWLDASWGNGAVDAELLADLRARSEICDDIVQMTLDGLQSEIASDDE